MGNLGSEVSELRPVNSRIDSLAEKIGDLGVGVNEIRTLDSRIEALIEKIGSLGSEVSELESLTSRVTEFAQNAVYDRYMELLKDIDGLEDGGNKTSENDAIVEIRNRIFERLSKEIRLLVSQGGGDASINLPLRTTLDRAEAHGMPAERIMETIDGAHPQVIMVNITWHCELKCPYCWHYTKSGTVTIGGDVVKIEQDAPTKDWICAFQNLPPALLDFVGGEPFIYKGWLELCKKMPRKHKYTITSNLHSKLLEKFVSMVSPHQCIHVTGSFHPRGNLTKEEFLGRLNIFRQAGFDVSINIVEYSTTLPHIPQLKKFFEEENGIRTDVNPWENPRDLKVLRPKSALTCNAGIRHVFINNNGDVYKCLTNFRYPDRDRALMGNLFRGDYRLFTERQACDRYCELYYIVDPKMEHYHYLDVRPASQEELERSAI